MRCFDLIPYTAAGWQRRSAGECEQRLYDHVDAKLRLWACWMVDEGAEGLQGSRAAG
jgi:hypothetical protein